MLEKVASTQAKAFILNTSGIAVMDTAVANHIIKITKASKLMGCTCLISGISGSVVQTIVELGAQTEEINTTGSILGALREALLRIGANVALEKSS